LSKSNRLRHDLVDAYIAPVCAAGLIDRLTRELVQASEGLEASGSYDEQTSDALPGMQPLVLSPAEPARAPGSSIHVTFLE
jgi:hypothetical protein